MLSALETRAVGRDWARQGIFEMLDAIFERAGVAELLFVESSNPASSAHDIIDRAFERECGSCKQVLDNASKV